MAGLAFWNAQTLMAPIDILQREGSDFARSKPVSHPKQQDRIVAFPGRRAPIDHLQHAAHLIPANGARDVRETIGVGLFHRGTEVLAQYPLTIQVAKKYADH